jgi:RNA polymerase sigma factor for flagellar operon FliA
MDLAKNIATYYRDTDRVSRDELITQNLQHVKGIVNRISGHLPLDVETDDLVNAGIIGLIDAATRYDPSRDNKFMTYATFRIKGAILSELRSRDFVSRSTRKKIRSLESAYLKLEQKSGGNVSDEEIANEMGVDTDELNEIKKMAGISFVSLDEIKDYSKKEKEMMLNALMDGRGEDALSMASLKEMESALAVAIDELPEKEKMVISLYYWDELTMKEIGKVLDITESRVSQIHSRAVIRLRSKLRKDNFIGD